MVLESFPSMWRRYSRALGIIKVLFWPHLKPISVWVEMPHDKEKGTRKKSKGKTRYPAPAILPSNWCLVRNLSAKINLRAWVVMYT